MKKILALILALLMVMCSFAACGMQDVEQENDNSQIAEIINKTKGDFYHDVRRFFETDF